MATEFKDKMDSKGKFMDFSSYIDGLRIMSDEIANNFENKVNNSSEKINEVFARMEEMEMAYDRNLKEEIAKLLVPLPDEKIGVDGLTDRQRSMKLLIDKETKIEMKRIELEKYKLDKEVELKKQRSRHKTYRSLLKVGAIGGCFLYFINRKYRSKNKKT